MGETVNPAGNPSVRLNTPDELGRPPDNDRVSLAPLDPETALRALLATPPPDRDQS